MEIKSKDYVILKYNKRHLDKTTIKQIVEHFCGMPAEAIEDRLITITGNTILVEGSPVNKLSKSEWESIEERLQCIIDKYSILYDSLKDLQWMGLIKSETIIKRDK